MSTSFLMTRSVRSCAWIKSHISYWAMPYPMRPGDIQKVDSEYVRDGACSIFAFIEPLGGRHRTSVHEHRTAFGWAEEIRYLVDAMYPDAEKIVLVMDNLNTHKPASLYKKYPP